MRERLEELGLISFCKTTGGKGLHVVTPLDVEEGRSTGRRPRPSPASLPARWRRTSPSAIWSTWRRSSAAGRIFLDYLRNDRMATAVAPLSPRARPGAPVSMPLTWSQVKKRPRSEAVHRAHRAALIRKSKAWEGYDAAASSIKTAIKKLAERL